MILALVEIIIFYTEIEESVIEEALPESKTTSSLFQQQQQLAPQSNKIVENEDSDSEGLIIPTEKDSKSSTLKDKVNCKTVFFINNYFQIISL